MTSVAARSMFKNATEHELEHCSVFVYTPETARTPAPVLLWIHGGGLLIGDARQDGESLTALADELGIIVASVQYRLAPRHQYPAALDDCVEAVSWLVQQPGIDPERLIVAGASAGGGLAAALCQRLKLDGGLTPSFQLLVYPMLDDRSAQGSGPFDHLFRTWDRKSNAYGWKSYLGNQPRTPPAVPGRLEDLSGLPPAWIGVGTADLFHDEDVQYANRLRAAGVPVSLEIVDGAYHGFDVADSSAPVSETFRRLQIEALRKHLDGPAT